MILRTHQTLFGRWKVCSIGHTEGDETWLATFRHQQDADNYVRARGWLRPFAERTHIAAQGDQVAEPAHHSEKPDVGSCIGATVGATRESKGTRDL